MLLLYCTAIVSLLFSRGYGLPGGPPISSFRDRICDQLLPNHGANTPRTGNGDYFILSDLVNNGGAYTAGQSYSRESGFELLYTVSLCILCNTVLV